MSAATAASSGRRVLVVDDEPQLRAAVRRALDQEGFLVDEAANGVDGLVAAQRCPPDAIILDLGLPGMQGIEVLAELRRASSIPILVLSGRGEEADRVAALEMGADDYVVKPFFARELGARIRGLLRRAVGSAAGAERIVYGSLTIDTRSREVILDGVLVDLTAKEFGLLAYLAAEPRRVVTREELLRAVWDSSAEWQDADTVTEHVRRVRKKIEVGPDAGWITTVRGVGYRFEPRGT